MHREFGIEVCRVRRGRSRAGAEVANATEDSGFAITRPICRGRLSRPGCLPFSRAASIASFFTGRALADGHSIADIDIDAATGSNAYSWAVSNTVSRAHRHAVTDTDTDAHPDSRRQIIDDSCFIWVVFRRAR